jgi:hypothetical protein
MVVRTYTSPNGRSMVVVSDGGLRRWDVAAESVELPRPVKRPPVE